MAPALEQSPPKVTWRRPVIFPRVSCLGCDAFAETQLSPICGRCERFGALVWGGSRCPEFQLKRTS